jgi:hypothetical protein
MADQVYLLPLCLAGQKSGEERYVVSGKGPGMSRDVATRVLVVLVALTLLAWLPYLHGLAQGNARS